MYPEEERDPRTITIRRSWTRCYRKAYTVKCLNKIIYTIATSDTDEVDCWIANIRSIYKLKDFFVGLGIQWRAFSNTTNKQTLVGRIATIQICVKNSCLIYQLLYGSHFPNSLRNFLEDDGIIFAVSRMNIDQAMLSSRLGIHLARPFEVSYHPSNGKQYSMEQMARMFLGFVGYPGEIKPVKISRSNWERKKLSMAQVTYATVDAYISLHLGFVLYRIKMMNRSR